MRPGPKRTLSEEAVLDAAMGLLAEGGAAAVTVRGIASRLGVAPNAVYTYVPNKAAVLSALVERLLGEVDLKALADPATPWRRRLHALALGLRERLIAQPGMVHLLLSGPMDGPNALALGECLLAVLAEAGLDPEPAARASYLLIVYVVGSIALEAAEMDADAPPQPEAERVAARRATFAAVPADRFPRTAAAAETMAGFISTEQFRWGLDRLLDGLTR
ncbi:TetR/AcrR family transcriptional regulator [Thermopolyspora sp. NPDC052614]|uniref:TetR/AcrR family transcriptional regulator n=1 Tax=Thermopolyspora sp. NPDC052614 TaxID=3155682 RepID=UPI003421DBB9